VNAATGAADLYPGFTGGDVHFTLSNPNPYPVTFTTMTAGTVVAQSVDAPGVGARGVDAQRGVMLRVLGVFVLRPLVRDVRWCRCRRTFGHRLFSAAASAGRTARSRCCPGACQSG